MPTESLLEPPIFLGVLRALKACEGSSPSDQDVYNALSLVEKETKSRVKLARERDRNLLRNSGQYWKGTGLLLPSSGTIELTLLGHKVAEGGVTQGEFAAIMVQQTTLPNLSTYKDTELKKWRNAGLEIKPLALILQVLETLGEISNPTDVFLTPDELIKVVIPLAGTKMEGAAIAKMLLKIRSGKVSVEGWPDCAPADNDKRLAREFLLFLSNYGICRYIAGKTNAEGRFYLDELFDVDAVSSLTQASIFDGNKEAEDVIEAVRSSPLPSIIERQRTKTTVLSRPGQPKFRKQVLEASEGCCLITGERITEVLEAAHIIPVSSGGTDERDNGICLRIDIHRLFDSGNIRIRPTGELQFSDVVEVSGNYKLLPPEIMLPSFVKTANLEWRVKYW
ncbi:MAG: HNH endonuclease [Candidatus Scalindua sp.]|nr:HNH endonuclease [Candidatus Scalindua sp.]